MRRKSSVATRLRKKQHTILWALLKAITIKRDGNKCVVCGKSGKGLNLSHIYPRGQYPRLEFDPENVFIQCTKHHLMWWHKNPIEAAEWYNQNISLKRRNSLKKKITNYSKLPKLDFQTCLDKLKKLI
jgi:5-methylcytosine-specific restriction endonuclease McrA